MNGPARTDWRLDLERNLALLAGAGTGKTYSLVTICLHLLGGARSDGAALRPSELCLLTFTDKAAGELRARLRERLDALSVPGAPADAEADLRAAFRDHDKPFPSPAEWRQIRDDLGAAAIGTFHSLCVQLLRRAPAGFDVDPAFELLDEGEARALVEDCAERVVLDALEREVAPVVDLCRELGFSGRGRAAGVVDFLVQVLQKVREEGGLVGRVPVGDPARERREFDELLKKAREALGTAMAKADASAAPHLAGCARALDEVRFETFEADWPRLKRLVSDPSMPSGRTAVGKLMKPFREAVRGEMTLAAAYAACAATEHERAFRTLLGSLGERVDQELRRRGALDFTGLLLRTRDLLRDHLEVRREVQERFRALLVDEFQDTNRLQLEIVTLIAEAREGGPRRVDRSAAAVLELPLEPRLLCAVGDRKQSIYEFRGADVSVFEELAKAMEAQGGVRGHLQVNRRSAPHLLDFFNALFAAAMAPQADAAAYEVAYAPEADDLKPHRGSRPGPWGVERIVLPEPPESAEEGRLADARAVALRVRALLASEAELEHRGGARGPVRGGDIAILLRRFTYVEEYRQELVREGVPHRVVRGRGFYGAQEVMDLASLLALVADPDDAVSFAAVLRSPLVALSDPSLVAIQLRAGGRFGLRPLLVGAQAEKGTLPGEEEQRLARFLELYRRLRAERGRLGARPLLRAALEETSYRVSLAATPFAEQALANVDKLLELAGRWDAAPSGDLAAFAREVLALADAEPREAQADVLDEGDPRAVQILTVHQAKGLEWPIVFVPDLSAGQKTNNERVLYDRRLGIGIKGWLAGDADVGRGPRMRRIALELGKREAAESKRLLYVALTRARDHLVLSGQRKTANGWWKLVDAALETSEALRALVRDVPPEPEAPKGQGTLDLPLRSPPAVDRAEEAIARVRSPRRASPKLAVFPVTQLQDYSRCPRRYEYAHVVGLAEAPLVFDVDEPVMDWAGPDPRQRGTLAHRLLERADLSLVAAPERLAKHLRELLWSEGVDPGVDPWSEVVTWAMRFLTTPLARRMSAAGAQRVHRELPFLLRLPPAQSGLVVHIKGQIDLLFEDDDGAAVVIDYKATRRHPSGLEPYAFQLDCYALAARAFVQEGVPVRTGIAYLREDSPGPDMRERVEADAGLEARLARLGAQLVEDVRTQRWQGVERPKCNALSCGYRYRCYGTERGS